MSGFSRTGPRCDSEVSEKGEGTLRDAYLDAILHVSPFVRDKFPDSLPRRLANLFSTEMQGG